MASKYSISAVFGLIDKITAPLDKVAGKGNAVGKALKNDFMQTDKAMQQLGKTAGKVAGDIAKAAAKAAAAVAAGTAAAAGAFVVKGLKDAVELEKGMAQIGARANLTSGQIKAMSNDLLNLSNATGTGIEALRETQLKIMESGISAADSVGVLEVAVKAAGGGFTSTTNVISGLSSVLKSYGLEASAATQISDQMMSAARAGGVSFEDMATKLEKVLPVAAKFGVSSDKLFAAVASMTAQGIPIADATKKIKSALEQDGAKGIFNVTNAAAFNNALNQITNSAGATNEAFERVDRTTGERWGSLINKVKNTGIKAGESLLPVFNKVIDKLSIFADKFASMDFEPLANKVESVVNRIFNSLDFDKLAGGITQVFDTISLLFNIVTTVGGALWSMRSIILGIAIAWGIYKAAQIAAVASAPIITLVKAIQMLASGQKVATVAQWAFNTAANANPIGIIITAIGVLIGLIIALAMNWDKVTAAMSRFGEWVKKIATMIRDGLVNAFWSLMDIINKNQEKVLALITIFTGPFGFVLSIINELRNNWAMVVETFKTDGIIAGIKKLGGVILSAMIAPIQGFLEILSRIPGVGKLLGPAVNKLDTLRADLKGTDGNVEKNVLTRPPVKEKAVKPAKAAKNTAEATKNVTPTATVTAADSVVTNTGYAPLPVNVTTSAAGTKAVRQATLLDLRSSPSGNATMPARMATTPLDSSGTINSAVSPAGAVTRASTAPQTPPAPVVVPVKYNFAEMIIPPEIIKTITLPVEFAASAGMPKEQTTKTISPVSINASVRENITPPSPPMTQAEQIIYSRTEHFENVNITVSPDEGTSARITKAPKSPNVKVTVSGDA